MRIDSTLHLVLRIYSYSLCKILNVGQCNAVNVYKLYYFFSKKHLLMFFFKFLQLLKNYNEL